MVPSIIYLGQNEAQINKLNKKGALQAWQGTEKTYSR